MEREKYLPGARRSLWAVVPKPIVVWIVLVLAGLAIWQLLAPSSAPSSGPSSAPSSGGSETPGTNGSSGSGNPVTSAIWMGVALVGVIGWGWWTRRRVRLFNEGATAAMKLFARAEYVAAADRFADLRRRFPYPRNVRETATFNLAMSLMRSGELERALTTLRQLDRRSARGAGSFAPTIAAQLAAIYALRGDPAAADRWIGEARARVKGAADSRAIDGAVAFARIVNELRRDDHQTAARDLQTAWADLEGTLVAAELRPFQILRAFAAARGAPSPTSGANHDAPPALPEVRPGELAWLGADWPEMRAFLDLGLSGSAPIPR
jgi:hypothetical protein